jgi:xylulokinase
MMGTFLCFDLGTTKVKSSLINKNGKIIYLSDNKVRTYKKDYYYQDPEDYFSIVIDEINKIKKQHLENFKNIECLICSGQMAGILGIDKNWKVVTPWTYSIDTNYIKYLQKLETQKGNIIRKYSGGVPTGAAKILWIKNEKPQDYKKIDKFINLNTYVAGKICGLKAEKAFIDYSVLTMHGLADIRKGSWNDNLIENLKLDRKKLPKIMKPYECVGVVHRKVFNTKLDIKVLVGCGDQVAGFIGAGVINKNDIIDAAGTYSVLGHCTDGFVDDSENKVISTVYSGIDNIYYQISVINAMGHTYDWFKKNFNYSAAENDINNNSSGGLFFVPHIGGRYNPPQSYFNGAWVGVKWEHSLDQFYISVLESIGYEFGYILDYIKNLNGLENSVFSKIKVIGGGAKNESWNKIKSNILGIQYLKMKQMPYEVFGGFLISRYKNKIESYKKFIAQNTDNIEDTINPDRKKFYSYKEPKKNYIYILEKMKEIFTMLNRGNKGNRFDE